MFHRQNRVRPRHSPVFPSHQGRFPPCAQGRDRAAASPLLHGLLLSLAHPVFAYLPDPDTPQGGSAPATFDRQASRKARRREEAVQGEGREVSLVPRNRRQHHRGRSGVAVLRVRKERNRTPAEADWNRAGAAGVRVLQHSRRWAVCKGVRPMNRTSRGRSRAVVSEGTREPNVRPTTPLNRLLGFAAGVGRAALGGSSGARQRLSGGPPLPRRPVLGACVGRASTQDPDEPVFSVFSVPSVVKRQLSVPRRPHTVRRAHRPTVFVRPLRKKITFWA